MKAKQKKLIKFLLEKDHPISAKELSVLIDSSNRTVTNYINEINGLSEEKIIFFSNEGYWLDKHSTKELLNEEEDTPQDFDERSLYIIKALLTEHAESLNIYELCEELFVSYSTIKNDLARMNQLYHYLDIRFSVKNNKIYLLGDESAKRKLMGKIIYDQHSDFLNLSALEESFPDVDVRRLSLIISMVLQKYHYYLNDFARINLIMHYAIFINRMKHGHYIVPNTNYDIRIHNSAEKGIINDIADQLKENFDLVLSQDELSEFLMLLKANARSVEVDPLELTSETIDPAIVSYTQTIIKKIQDLYYIDLNDDQFIIPFIIHIKYLIARNKQDIHIRNPLLSSLKQMSPVLLDAAAYIANDICDHFHLKKHFNQDEIGFIAIHLGAQIERQNKDIDKIDAILLCPDYIQLAASVRNKILFNLGTKINIIATISDPNEIFKYPCDLILSTVSLTDSISISTCKISPFVSETDIARIFSIVCEIIDHRNLQILRNDFDYYFNERLFLFNEEDINKEKAICLMADRLISNGNVSSSYEQEVLKREQSVSTSFGHFALPHSFEMDALNTGICILVSKTGIEWDKDLVHLVLMIALNKKDMIYFYQLYEAIIALLSQESTDKILKNVKDFQTFKKTIDSLTR